MRPAPHIALQLLKALEDAGAPGAAHAAAFAKLIRCLNVRELKDNEWRLRTVMSRFRSQERALLQQQLNAELRRQSWNGTSLDVSDLSQTIIALEGERSGPFAGRGWLEAVRPIEQEQPPPSSELLTAPPPQWRRYVLSGTRIGYGRFPKENSRALEPVHIAVYERLDLPEALEDRDFRVWSQRYDDEVDWSYSHGCVEVEGRNPYLVVELGYRLEFPRRPLIGGFWGHVFRLTLLTSLGIPDVRRRAEEEELQRISGVPKFLLTE